MEGMRIGVKAEKLDNFDGSKKNDVDTWLFQVRENLDLTVIPERGHVPYAASLFRGNTALGGERFAKAIGALQIGKIFVLHCMNNFAL